MATKVSIVTGAGRGIGKSFAGVLLKEGYKVSIMFIFIEFDYHILIAIKRNLKQ